MKPKKRKQKKESFLYGPGIYKEYFQLGFLCHDISMLNLARVHDIMNMPELFVNLKQVPLATKNSLISIGILSPSLNADLDKLSELLNSDTPEKTLTTELASKVITSVERIISEHNEKARHSFELGYNCGSLLLLGFPFFSDDERNETINRLRNALAQSPQLKIKKKLLVMLDKINSLLKSNKGMNIAEIADRFTQLVIKHLFSILPQSREIPYLGRYVKLAVLLQKLNLESEKLLTDNLQKHKPFTNILKNIPGVLGKNHDPFLSKIISKIEKNEKTFMQYFDLYMLQITKNLTLAVDTLMLLIKSKRHIVEKYFYSLGLSYQDLIQLSSYLKENRELEKWKQEFEETLNMFLDMLRREFIFTKKQEIINMTEEIKNCLANNDFIGIDEKLKKLSQIFEIEMDVDDKEKKKRKPRT